MIAPGIPENEAERLSALHELYVLDTPLEPALEALTRLVKSFFDVPIVAISLVDGNRQWFKSIQGLDVRQTGRDVSFCGHTILQDSILIVEDATQDKRFYDNPLVTAEPNIRYYAGSPIRGRNGHHIGTLCIIDSKPRHIPAKKIQQLKDFVIIIEKELQAKRSTAAYLSEVATIQEMHISGAKERELFAYILNFLIKRTASGYGFFAPVCKNKTGQYVVKKCFQFVEEGGQQGKVSFKDLQVSVAESLTTGELVVSGPHKSCDSNTYVGVPVHGSDGLLAIYGLANRLGGYDAEVVEELLTLTKLLSSVVGSAKNMAAMEEMASKDALTETYNRHYLKKYVINRIWQPDRVGDLFLLMIDVDNFKHVNDYYGHPVGDKLLVEFSSRIKACLQKEDVIARIGGDEFIIVLEGRRYYAAVEILAEQIIAVAQKPYLIDAKVIKSSISIGVATHRLSGDSYNDLMRHVDLALYEAKKKKNHVIFYSDDLDCRFKRRLNLEEAVRKAFKKNDFYCLYQPQVDMRSNQIVGIEALVRWRGKEDMLLADYLSTIEDIGLSGQLNAYVLGCVLRDLHMLRGVHTPLKVAVNISFLIDDFKHEITDLISAITRSGLPENLVLEFEVTESSVIRTNDLQVSELMEIMAMVKDANIKLAIDDFGMQHSSINRLIDYKFNTIKLDKSYIDKLHGDQSKVALAVVHALMSLASDLGLQAVAEGVESANQCRVLQSCGCHVAQGFYFYKPMPMSDIVQLLQSENQVIKEPLVAVD